MSPNTTKIAFADIVFVDIVSFSKYDEGQQERIITSLNAELSRELFRHLSRASSDPSMICLPTGDGMALVFVKGCEDRVLVSLIYCLINWTKTATEQEGLDKESGERRKCEIRIGVHAGSVLMVTDINRHINVCGDAINTCRRIMDQARPNQVLISDRVYDRFRRDGKYTGFPFSTEKPAVFSRLELVTAKHDQPLKVRVMYHQGEEGWNHDSPKSIPRVIDGKSAAVRRTELMNGLLEDLAASPQKEVTIYEQASFSTFGITEHMEKDAGYDRKLVELCVRQRTLLEELMLKKATTVKVIIRPIPDAPTEWEGVNIRLTALARWMDANLVGDTFRPAEAGNSPRSMVQFREGLADELEFWRSGGPNVFMVRDLVRIDGYRIRNNVSHGLSLVYYEEQKIREAIDEFDVAFCRAEAEGQTNEDVRKKLEVFLPCPGRSNQRQARATPARASSRNGNEQPARTRRPTPARPPQSAKR